MATGSLSSEDGDAMSSVSTKMTESRRPSVLGLRDRLLREARSERQRCLEVAEAAERRRAELRGLCNVAVQTDPVFVMGGPGGLDSTAPAGGAAREVWTESDDKAQQEALQTIQMLASEGTSSKVSEGRVEQLEEMLRAEKSGREELQAELEHHRIQKDAAQQQVLCLEYELDGKEAALHVAERALERRNVDLQQAQVQVRALQEDLDSASRAGGSSTPGVDDPRLRALRAQLTDREQQLEQKDAHITRLLAVLRQQRSIAMEDDLDVCGSDPGLPASHLNDRGLPASMVSVTTNGLIHGM